MAHDALLTILPIAGWPEERTRTVEITGGADPALPTPFRIGAAGATGDRRFESCSPQQRVRCKPDFRLPSR
jgi:hypothetical protein